MACRTLTKTHFTSEQSLSFPLCVACSVRKLGWTNNFPRQVCTAIRLHNDDGCAMRRRFQKDCLV